jgi:acyl-CoA dehydrogenase
MYRCYREALAWTQHRVTFGAPLIERPMIQDDILNIATTWMAGSALAFESARAFTAAQENPADKKREAWSRVITALAKYRTAEGAVQCAKTVLELVGGNGYARDHAVERIYRDAMVLPVWEGPRHIQALELVRMLSRGDGAKVFLDEMRNRATHWPTPLHPLKFKLEKIKAHLIVDLGKLAKDPALAEQAANRLLDRMSDIAAVTLLADEAAWEYAHEKDATKIAVAEHLYNSLFVREAALHLDAPPLRAHFEALVNGRNVPPPPARTPSKPAPQP